MVVGSVLTATLALVALPGLAGSRAPSPIEPLPAGAFQPLSINATSQRSIIAVEPLDPAFRSDGALEPSSTIGEPPEVLDADGLEKPTVRQPATKAGSVRKPAKSVLRGDATFYDNGTTAMRLPRGTVVVICGAGGCIERVVTDYGPQKKTRVVDLYRPDFFRICGCGWWDGVTRVTVYVY
jgi:hypothetical protein